MGRRFCPAKAIAPILRARRFLRLSLALGFALSGAASLAGAWPAAAETPPGSETKKPLGETAKMFVEADELRYDTEKNIVSAEGNARLYYKGRTLEADRVVYNRNTGRVDAEGHAKLTERDGTVLHGERFDLTDDFRDGFIESLRADTPPKPYKDVLGAPIPGAPANTDKTATVAGAYKSYFSAPRAERIEGDTTVFDKGTYTVYDVCKDNPYKPPLWRVRAKRIIHKNDEKMIYYEDASLEFLGIPLAYVPFFSAPDPSVKRKSGILSPYLADNSQLGVGVGIPIFWALAPDYDLTFTPIYYSQQGFFAKTEWR
ncbi:MAG: LPS-assembly protein LptD, partial [Methylocella sp.]